MLTMWLVSGNGISGPAIVWLIHSIKRTSQPLIKEATTHLSMSPQPSVAVKYYTPLSIYVGEMINSTVNNSKPLITRQPRKEDSFVVSL